MVRNHQDGYSPINVSLKPLCGVIARIHLNLYVIQCLKCVAKKFQVSHFKCFIHHVSCLKILVFHVSCLK